MKFGWKLLILWVISYGLSFSGFAINLSLVGDPPKNGIVNFLELCSEPANYRPVSLTCTCCKLLEHIIDSNLMRHLSAFNILADNQHAFRKRRSCESQLILTMNDLSKNIDGKKTTDMAVLDFSKAFDVIPHSKLLMKLDYYGIRANTKDWIASFLTKRYQRVCVNGQSSDWKPVLSGTPQGTVLAPHLFLLHINDIHHQVSSTTRLFADDCLVYREINSAEDEAALQSDLNTMVNWSKTWGMHFNPTKCKAMRVSRKRTPGKTNYNILGVDLEETVETQYLGIFIHKDIRWNKQTQHASAKATRTLNFVKRNFHHCSPSVKEKLDLDPSSSRICLGCLGPIYRQKHPSAWKCTATSSKICHQHVWEGH